MDQRLVTSWVVGLFDGAEDFGDGPFFMVIFWQWWQGSWALWWFSQMVFRWEGLLFDLGYVADGVRNMAKDFYLV